MKCLNRKHLFILPWLILLPIILQAQYPAGYYQDRIHKEGIASPQCYRSGWDLSYPVIELGSGDRITLDFDELADHPGNYSYTFIHCDAFWHDSGLSKSEFLNGFTENQVRDYRLSFNTTVNYVHYRLEFPNEDVNFRLSGNYIVLVYEDYDEMRPVLTKRFSVYENLVGMQVTVKPPMLPEFSRTGQEVDVEVNHASYPVRDPMDEIFLVIRQNGRWDNAVSGLKPLFIRGSILSFDYNRENVFPGLNEFRYFDIKSFRYQTEFVRNIDYRSPYYHIELAPCKSRANQGYFSDPEINGKFKIESQEGQHPETDADYAWVYFSYPAPFPFEKADVYVIGDLTGWGLDEKARMNYSASRHQYELSLLLKQGYYNYLLGLVPRKGSQFDIAEIEGSHRETENEYLVYVFHRSPGSRYDKLIGFSLANSESAASR